MARQDSGLFNYLNAITATATVLSAGKFKVTPGTVLDSWSIDHTTASAYSCVELAIPTLNSSNRQVVYNQPATLRVQGPPVADPTSEIIVTTPLAVKVTKGQTMLDDLVVASTKARPYGNAMRVKGEARFEMTCTNQSNQVFEGKKAQSATALAWSDLLSRYLFVFSNAGTYTLPTYTDLGTQKTAETFALEVAFWNQGTGDVVITGDSASTVLTVAAGELKRALVAVDNPTVKLVG